MGFVKLPSHVGLTKYMTGEWKIDTLKQYIDEGIVSSPSRKSVDEMVEVGTHVVEFKGESREFQFTEAMRDKLIKAEVISQRAAPSATKREFVSDEQKEMYNLFQKGNKLISDFIAGNDTLQAISNLKFQDEEGEFQVVPSHYIKNVNRALEAFEQPSEN